MTDCRKIYNSRFFDDNVNGKLFIVGLDIWLDDTGNNLHSYRREDRIDDILYQFELCCGRRRRTGHVCLILNKCDILKSAFDELYNKNNSSTNNNAYDNENDSKYNDHDCNIGSYSYNGCSVTVLLQNDSVTDYESAIKYIKNQFADRHRQRAGLYIHVTNATDYDSLNMTWELITSKHLTRVVRGIL